MNIKMLLVLLFLFIALAFVGMSLWQHTEEIYIGAMGQKRAIQLAETLVESRKDFNFEGINTLAKQNWFVDANGIAYRIVQLGDGGFEIVYEPRNNTQRLFFPAKTEQKLNIRWTPSTQRIDVNSTIVKP